MIDPIPIPFEVEDPILGEHIRRMVNDSTYPVKGIASSVHGLVLLTEDRILKTKTERNVICPCGSGKKYKKCCMNGDRGCYDYFDYPKRIVSKSNGSMVRAGMIAAAILGQ